MATKARILLPGQGGVVPLSAAGSIATFDCPLGWRYHQVDLIYVDGSGAPADWLNIAGDVIVLRNSIPQRTHSALEIDHLNGLNGSQYQRQQNGAGAAMRQQQTIYFAEPWRKSKRDTDTGAWSVDDANGWNSFQIKVTLLLAMPATATLIAMARVDAPIAPANGPGSQTLKKVYRQQLPANGISADVTTLDKKDAYQTICMKHPTGAYIQYATLKSGTTIMFENVQQQDNVNDLVNLGLNPASSQAAGAFGYDIVLDADDPIVSALPVTPQMPIWLKLTFSGAATGNVIALIERLGPAD